MQQIRRLFKYYFYSIKKLEKDWELYRGKKQFYQKWLDAEEILSYKAGWIKKLR